jgi:hypothetical protein
MTTAALPATTALDLSFPVVSPPRELYTNLPSEIPLINSDDYTPPASTPPSLATTLPLSIGVSLTACSLVFVSLGIFLYFKLRHRKELKRDSFSSDTTAFGGWSGGSDAEEKQVGLDCEAGANGGVCKLPLRILAESVLIAVQPYKRRN